MEKPIKDSESDTQANIDSDHLPLWAQVSVNLKAHTVKQGSRAPRYVPCSDSQREEYNNEIGSRRTLITSYASLTTQLPQAASTTIPVEQQHEKKGELSMETRHILEQREEAIKLNSIL